LLDAVAVEFDALQAEFGDTLDGPGCFVSLFAALPCAPPDGTGRPIQDIGIHRIERLVPDGLAPQLRGVQAAGGQSRGGRDHEMTALEFDGHETLPFALVWACLS